jgi:uncharacterized membrane protein
MPHAQARPGREADVTGSTDDKPREQKKTAHVGMGVLIGVGAGVGVVLGVLLGNIAVGLACGAGVGVVAGAILESSRRGR